MLAGEQGRPLCVRTLSLVRGGRAGSARLPLCYHYEVLGEGQATITQGASLCVIRSCETSLARGPSYGLSLSSTLGFWFQRPRL
jgi:hypothetical protein